MLSQLIVVITVLSVELDIIFIVVVAGIRFGEHVICLIHFLLHLLIIINLVDIIF